MHKSFYVSGFIYDLSSQQILLQQDNTLHSVWSLLAQKGQDDKSPLNVFQKAVFQQLHINLDSGKIYPVYDYFNNELEKNFYIFYAEIARRKREPPESMNYTTEWFTFKQVKKLFLSNQTKQDILVAERVIKAKERDDETILSPLEAPDNLTLFHKS